MRTETVSRQKASEWLRRWDTQQSSFYTDREERFRVMGDVVEAALAEVDEPVILDLGCGPGSLAIRLRERLPRARIIGIDSDPLLLGLARAAYPEEAEWVDADLAGPAWRAHVPGQVHAAVSTTALHWLTAEGLGSLYRALSELLVPGGVFVNGDHMGLDDDGLDTLADRVHDRSLDRAGVRENEGWLDWWDAVLADDDLADLARARAERVPTQADADSDHKRHHGTNGFSVGAHQRLLVRSGFRAAHPVWQVGNDHVLVGSR
ncbi:class I SAM-dependent methyltransferase [Sciscionella marina]|uniref:class I SAM-dependent methyltransferase n=1 Tax=Sciscionella marina TaxID=508770 RepID=UPI00037F3118|nr:class I SAM-dependent methyltransferase [Sciscionella marina]